MNSGELLCRCDGAMLFVSKDDAQPALTAQGTLHVYSVSSKDGASACCKAQVGDVYWSLSKEVACVRVDKCTFSFSVPESPGLCVTALLPLEAPEDQLDQLATVLADATTYKEGSGVEGATDRGTEHPPDSMESKARQAAKTAGWVLRGAAQGISFGMAKGAEFIVQRIAPADQPAKVSEQTMKRLESARDMAGKVASVTGRVASGVAKVTTHVAQDLATRIKSSGLSEHLTRRGVDVEGASRVFGAGIIILQEVFDALEQAGLQVLHSLSAATTHVVDHRFGAEAAAATQVGMGAAVNVAHAHRNLHVLRPYRIVRATAKGTAYGLATSATATTTATTSTTTVAGPDGVTVATRSTGSYTAGTYAADGISGVTGMPATRVASAPTYPSVPQPAPAASAPAYPPAPQPAVHAYPAPPAPAAANVYPSPPSAVGIEGQRVVHVAAGVVATNAGAGGQAVRTGAPAGAYAGAGAPPAAAMGHQPQGGPPMETVVVQYPPIRFYPEVPGA